MPRWPRLATPKRSDGLAGRRIGEHTDPWGGALRATWARRAAATVGLDRLSPLPRNLAIGLVAAYVATLLGLAAAPRLVADLTWTTPPWSGAPWTVVTTFFVILGDPLSVLLSTWMSAYLVTILDRRFTRRQLGSAALGALGGGWTFALLAQAVGLPGLGPVGPWSLLGVGLVLWGRSAPDEQVSLFGVVPVRAALFVWGALAVHVLRLLAALPGTEWVAPLFGLGTWVGVMAWWQTLGPGARRRRAIAKGKVLERSFLVVPGGRDTFHRARP